VNRSTVVAALAAVSGAFVTRGLDAAFAASAAEGTLPARLIAAFDAAFRGPHAGERANHAKGFIARASFVPSSTASSLSIASHFATPCDALVRFSDFGGYPAIADNVAGASPYGIAVKFKLGDGDTDIVGHSSPYFPASTAEAFIGFLSALGGGAGALQAYVDEHPAARTFVASLRSAPISYATLSYHFINTFRLVDRAGQRQTVRYELRSHEPVSYHDPRAAQRLEPNYLRTEMETRLTREPVRFDYLAHIAEATDRTDDPTVVWPAGRRLATIGTLAVHAIDPASAHTQHVTLFDPARLTAGIELSDDPMVLARSQAYARSFARRVS
jgi:catalase